MCLTEDMHPAEPGSYLLCRSVLDFSLQKSGVGVFREGEEQNVLLTSLHFFCCVTIVHLFSKSCSF